MTDSRSTQEMRDEICRAIDSNQVGIAQSMIRTLWERTRDVATASWISRLATKAQADLDLKPLSITLLRSATFEPMLPVFVAEAICHGLLPDVRIGKFDTWMEDILRSDGDAYGDAIDAVILAVHLSDVAPELWHGFTTLKGRDIESVVERVSNQISLAVTEFRNRSSAALVVHSFQQPPHNAHGVLDSQLDCSQAQVIHQLNWRVADMVRDVSGAYVLDYDALTSRCGRERWQNESKWQTARLAVAPENYQSLAREWCRFLCPLAGLTCKVLVVDLDNTLWGGILGEDGLENLQIGPDYPGTAFLELHRVVLDLSRRGIILAICSKNDHEDAVVALDSLEHGLLRSKHFAAFRINWQDKATNLREIAGELNVGLEALAFLDDNPVERHHVHLKLPEVKVIELPQKVEDYAAQLRNNPFFERLSLQAEDRQRADEYVHQRRRRELRNSVDSLAEFYHSLDLTVQFFSLSDGNCGRLAQLTQRTNQFNLTTRRYNESQLRNMAADEDCDMIAIGVRDRFSNNGIVGLAIVRHEDGVSSLDTFLLSCRVIGRTIETALLAEVVRIAKRRNSGHLTGVFIPTARNKPAVDLYKDHGFRCISDDESSIWELEIDTASIAFPKWIRLEQTA